MLYELINIYNFPYYELKLILQFIIAVSLCCFCVFIQYKRLNKTLPIFDPGMILILTTTLYCTYPIFSYVMSGFTWSQISDRRLWDYNVSTAKFSDFMMLPFYYLLSLVLSYIVFCGTQNNIKKYKPTIISSIKKTDALIVLILFVIIKSYFFIIHNYFTGPKLHIWLQLNNFLSSLSFPLFIFLLVNVFINWKNKILKTLLFSAIFYQAYLTFIEGYGRTALFLQIISCVMAYHYFIKKIKFRFALLSFVSLFLVFIIRGFLKVGLTQSFGEYSAFSAANEFTILIGTAYDIYSRIQNGLIDFIPFQAYFNDILLLVPSQFLPFQKLDLSQWYLQQLNLQGTGVGMMFGVVSQGVIGGGIPELIIRGIILGYCFARLFKWFYQKENVSPWAVVFMIFVAVKSYYTYRAGTGYLLYFIVYHFFGAYLLYFLTSKLISKLKLKL